MNKILELIVVLLIICSCNEKPKENSEHWSYQGETGPENWAEIEKQSDCDGKKQSPINIIDIEVKDDASLLPLDIHYSDSVKIHDVTNNGHSIQYNFEEGDYITIGNRKFDLKQIHFHEASEHTINGVHFPLEIHMVHINSNNEIAVLSTLAVEGTSNSAFDFLESYLPVKVGETKPISDYFDLNLNLPENKEYYFYEGSLTTPPCTEGVKWYVFKTPVIVSLKQVKQLQELMPLNNYRDEQPINGRSVKQMPAKKEAI
ncbi:MAG: carbonic anhydrase family protein [Bacteroidota bacterium]